VIVSPYTVSELLRWPISYDIIIGDFGRDATIEYLRLVARHERHILEPILSDEGREFFDEYRRIMFVVLGDVAFFKRDSIERSIEGRGYFADDILMGVGFTPPPQDFIDRVAISVACEVSVALAKGYERIRIAIPCNGLSALGHEVAAALRSEAAMRALMATYGIEIPGPERVAAARPEVYSVPDAVLKHVSRRSAGGSVLLLGTRGTNDIYRDCAAPLDIRVLPIDDGEYALINRAIVAAIGGNTEALESCRERLRSEIVEHRRRQFPELVVVEACTDFDLGLGVSSLKIFAEEMATGAYPGLNSHKREGAQPA
jgi:hypothetical protein